MYAKIFSSLYQGTLRGRSNEILVFTNLLAHCDKEGYVDKHFRAIAEETGICQDDVKSAIAILEQPDEESRSPEAEGRRIVRIDDHRAWGWQVVNFLKYRGIRDEEARRETWRKSTAKRRARQHVSTVVNTCQPSSTHTDTDTDTKADTETKKEDLLSASGRPERSNFIELLWIVFPPTSRNRSSKQKVADAWAKTKSKPDEGDTIAAASKWASCDDWTKDGGKYAPGAHIWIKDRKWESLPEITQGNFAGIQENIPFNA